MDPVGAAVSRALCCFSGLGFSSSSQWDLMGTAMVTPDHVRLTPDLQSRQGAVWSRVVSPIYFDVTYAVLRWYNIKRLYIVLYDGIYFSIDILPSRTLTFHLLPRSHTVALKFKFKHLHFKLCLSLNSVLHITQSTRVTCLSSFCLFLCHTASHRAGLGAKGAL